MQLYGIRGICLQALRLVACCGLLGASLALSGCDAFSDPGKGSAGSSAQAKVPADHPFCLNSGCHAGKVFDPLPPVVSQRDWQTVHGPGVGNWTKRGVHPVNDSEGPPSRNVSCYACHAQTCENCHDNPDHLVHANGPEAPTFPIKTLGGPGQNCANDCHAWVRPTEDVTTVGFVNLAGDPAVTTYTGTIGPAELLELAALDKPAHNDLYVTYGCNGFCHGGPDAPHGTVTPCKSCHNFKFSNATEGEQNLHSTHATLVQGEQPAADPDGFQAGKIVCDYCHAAPSAACWNCHLSGHDPITKYWELPSG